jgi:hypothetical protein
LNKEGVAKAAAGKATGEKKSWWKPW